MNDGAKWEIKDGTRRLAYGSELSLPSVAERKRFQADGYQVYIDGRLLKKKDGGEKSE